MRKEPDNQSFGNETAKNDSKTAVLLMHSRFKFRRGPPGPDPTFSTRRTGGEDIGDQFYGTSTFTSCKRWCRCQHIGAVASTFRQDPESTQSAYAFDTKWNLIMGQITTSTPVGFTACLWTAMQPSTYSDMGETEATPVIHAGISCPTSTQTGWEISLSNFGENNTTPSMQLRMDSEAMDAYLSRNLLKPLMMEHYFILANNQPFLSCKQCLEQRRLSASR